MVTIRSIELFRSMACITLDDGHKVWIARNDLLESGWREGSDVVRKDFEQFILFHQYPRALNRAVSMLARRLFSKDEICQNLRQHHYNDDVIDLVICKLEKEKLLNDREFSELWVQSRIKKYGSNRIRQELKRKGVSESLVNYALSQISDTDMLKNATALALKAWSRIKPGEDIRKFRQKVIASLVQKGFDWGMAKKASDSAEKNK